jgi:hypothetical protein
MPDADMNGTPVIDVTSTDITLQPGEEVTYCFYFHTSNTSPVAVNKWVGDMTTGSHHLIVFTGGPAMPDGLDMTNSCGLGTSAQNPPTWVFASQTLHSELDLPADDGGGKPLAEVIQPNSEVAIQMHYLNSTDNVLTAHDTVKAYALASGTQYTPTAAYNTYNNSISIPPHATGFTVTASCPAPPGKIWLMSTHAHKQMVDAKVSDASTMLVDSTDWEHPNVKTWDATPFYAVGATDLTWSCTYDNTGPNANNTVVSGASAATNEMCMATGYYFPASASKICLVDAQIPTADHCFCQ